LAPIAEDAEYLEPADDVSAESAPSDEAGAGWRDAEAFFGFDGASADDEDDESDDGTGADAEEEDVAEAPAVVGAAEEPAASARESLGGTSLLLRQIVALEAKNAALTDKLAAETRARKVRTVVARTSRAGSG